MSRDLEHKLEFFANQATQDIQNVKNFEELGEAKIRFLGKKSGLTEILKSLGESSPEERKIIGQKANELKTLVTEAISRKEQELKRAQVRTKLESEKIDVSLDGAPYAEGHLHPVTLVFEDCKKIFRHLGFDIAEGPEIETDYYNFEALNIPPNHPARDMQDTFYFEDGRVLRTHTSPVQIRVMERQKPPIAIVAPGVVYRHDYDLTHTPMFHQLEALLVDRHIHFGHMKAVIQEFLQTLFEKKLDFRFRASFFPFTEPSAEVDISCVFCRSKGCRVCSHTGWLEIMGCGMVDPNVFQAVDIDSNTYSGFAFGMGIERVAMLKFGINDLRLFFENDIRFLEQF